MVQFASRMNLLKGSEIRELLKLTAQPDILSFAGGMPAPELFPVEQMMEASIAVLKEHGREALQYSTTEGFPRLREQIAERMLAKNNIHTDKDHILVTSGSQQGLDFSARVFLNPGDVVLLESPSYLGAVNAFKACEPTFIEVPTDDGGMIMEELEKILATTERVKMIYVIPDFQNPTGRTWDLERRHQFMEIVNRYEIPVIEDNPYGELRFEGEYLTALCAAVGGVLQCGFFGGRLNLAALQYFTLMSNILCAAYFAGAAVRTLRRGDTWLPVCKGALVMAMAITGITFHLFLAAGDFNMGPTQLITNHLLHTAAPLLTVLDWLLFDEKGHYRRFEPFLWGIFPAAYFVYTMIRARVSSFRFYNGSPYPYPFMDVDALGWGKVLLIFLAMAAAFLALGYVLVWIDHLLARRQKR